jgi:hypothetical protein
VPFVRFSRDKKGYEHVYLMHIGQTDGRPAPRTLYWYRTPPGVKVGREPFDESVRRALEARYPDVEFDWTRIVNTPMPPPEAENWRERRRAERAMKQARRGEERAAHGGDADGGDVAEVADVADERDEERSVPHDEEPHVLHDEERRGADDELTAAEEPSGSIPLEQPAAGTANAGPASDAAAVADAPQERRRRRRRGGRRRRKQRADLAAAGASGLAAGESESAAPESETDAGDAAGDADADAFDEGE